MGAKMKHFGMYTNANNQVEVQEQKLFSTSSASWVCF